MNFEKDFFSNWLDQINLIDDSTDWEDWINGFKILRQDRMTTARTYEKDQNVLSQNLSQNPYLAKCPSRKICKVSREKSLAKSLLRKVLLVWSLFPVLRWGVRGCGGFGRVGYRMPNSEGVGCTPQGTIVISFVFFFFQKFITVSK